MLFASIQHFYLFFRMNEHVTTAAFTVSEALNKGWELTKKHWQRFLLISIACAIVYGVISLIAGAILSDSPVGSFIMQLISWVVSAVLSIVITRFLLNAYDGKSTAFDVLLKLESKMVVSIILFFILYGIAVTLGLMLFIVPGIILALGWYFTSYLIIDKKMELMPAFKTSWAMTKGSRGNLFLFCLAIALPVIILVVISASALFGAIMGTGSLGIAALLALVLLVVVGVISQMIANFGLVHIYRKLEAKPRVSG